jgi:hypothetical protein
MTPLSMDKAKKEIAPLVDLRMQGIKQQMKFKTRYEL